MGGRGSGVQGGDADRSAAGGVAAAPRTAEQARPNHSPVVLRMAELHGIDLGEVAGTGRNGRISKQDVEAYLVSRPVGGAGARGLARTGAGSSGSGPGGAGSSGAGPGGGGSSGGAVDGPERETVSEPLSRMRRAIAEHMTRSLGTAAHCTTMIEVDMSAIVRARRAAGLGLLPYVARCVAESLCVFGAMNATLEGDILTRHGSVNLGIAVSLGEDGLIVPVIEPGRDPGCGRAGGADPDDLGARAREHRLHRTRSGAGRSRSRTRQVGDDGGNADHQPATGGDPRAWRR